MAAAMCGRTKAVSALLKKGAKVNVQDNFGKTALILATEKRHTEVERLLIAAAQAQKIKAGGAARADRTAAVGTQENPFEMALNKAIFLIESSQFESEQYKNGREKLNKLMQRYWPAKIAVACYLLKGINSFSKDPREAVKLFTELAEQGIPQIGRAHV